MNIDHREECLEIPIDVFKEDKYYVFATTDHSERLLCHPICSQGESLEDAERKFWAMHKCMFDYYKERADKADKWVPFERGPWNHRGGKVV